MKSKKGLSTQGFEWGFGFGFAMLLWGVIATLVLPVGGIIIWMFFIAFIGG